MRLGDIIEAQVCRDIRSATRNFEKSIDNMDNAVLTLKKKWEEEEEQERRELHAFFENIGQH